MVLYVCQTLGNEMFEMKVLDDRDENKLNGNSNSRYYVICTWSIKIFGALQRLKIFTNINRLFLYSESFLRDFTGTGFSGSERVEKRDKEKLVLRKVHSVSVNLL